MIYFTYVGILLSLIAYGAFDRKSLKAVALLTLLPHVITLLSFFGGSEAVHASRFMMLLFLLLGNSMLWIHFMTQSKAKPK